MLPIDVTFDTGEETERGRKRKNIVSELRKTGHELCISASNRPRSIYQYSNMAPRLSGQTSIFGIVFFVFESLLGIERQKKL